MINLITHENKFNPNAPNSSENESLVGKKGISICFVKEDILGSKLRLTITKI
jgi:hypothetical protein